MDVCFFDMLIGNCVQIQLQILKQLCLDRNVMTTSLIKPLPLLPTRF